MIGQDGVPRPSFHAFTLLHRFGDRRMDTGDAPVVATLRSDGGLAVLAWNLITVQDKKGTSGNPVAPIGREPMLDGPSKTLRLEIAGRPDRVASIQVVDPADDRVAEAFKAMGKPVSPTRDQLAALHAASRLPAPHVARLNGRTIDLTLPPNSLVLMEVAP